MRLILKLAVRIACDWRKAEGFGLSALSNRHLIDWFILCCVILFQKRQANHDGWRSYEASLYFWWNDSQEVRGLSFKINLFKPKTLHSYVKKGTDFDHVLSFSKSGPENGQTAGQRWKSLPPTLPRSIRPMNKCLSSIPLHQLTFADSIRS